MKMSASRPLEWAKGTDFDPLFDDASYITFKIYLGNCADIQTYGQLVGWMIRNVNAGETRQLSLEEAGKFWEETEASVLMILLHFTNLFILEHKHRNTMAISSDDEEDDQPVPDDTE